MENLKAVLTEAEKLERTRFLRLRVGFLEDKLHETKDDSVRMKLEEEIIEDTSTLEALDYPASEQDPDFGQ